MYPCGSIERRTDANADAGADCPPRNRRGPPPSDRASAQACGGTGRGALPRAALGQRQPRRAIPVEAHDRPPLARPHAEAKADEYEKYSRRPASRRSWRRTGNHGVEVLRRADGPKTDFIVISYWESIEAVKKFAGADYQKAVIIPRDKEFLVEVEPGVVHYEVVRAGGK